MKRVISLILAVALVACFCIVPITAADGAPTAKLTAKLAGDTVPQPGEKFIVSVAFEGISSDKLISAAVPFNWTRDVATLVKFKGDSVDPTTGIAGLGNYPAKWDAEEEEGKYTYEFTYEYAEGTATVGYAGLTVYVPNSANSQPFPELTNGDLKLFDIAFVLNEGKSFDDFAFDFHKEAMAYFTEGVVSTVVDGDITVEGIGASEPEPEEKLESVKGQVAEAVFQLPKQIKTTGTVKFTLEVGGTDAAKDAMIGITKGEAMTPNNFFNNSAALVLVGNDKTPHLAYSEGSGKRDELVSDADFAFNAKYDVEIVIDNVNKTWSVKVVKEDGTVLAEKTGLSMRYKDADVIDSIVLTDNGGGQEGALVVTNLKVETDDEQPEPPSEEDSTAPSEEDSTAPSEEDSTAPSEEDSTAPSEEDSTAPSEEDSTAPSEEDSTAPSEEDSSEAPTAPADAIVASKTDSINADTASVGYPDHPDRVQSLIGTDAMFSASWGQVRYGEMAFAIKVGEGEAITKATLTLTPAEIMDAGSHRNEFDIYAVDPASFGVAEPISGTVVGSGAFAADLSPASVEIDLTNYFVTYPDATEVVLAWKVTEGLIGVYGASFEGLAPYIVVEIGEAPEVPSEDESKEEPSDDPSVDPDAKLPLDAKVTANEAGNVFSYEFTKNDTAEGVAELENGKNVVVVVSIYVDGKPYLATAVERKIYDGEPIKGAADIKDIAGAVDGKVTLESVVVLGGITPLDALLVEGSLGTPLGAYPLQ